MVTRPASIPDAKGKMRVALANLNDEGKFTPCAGKPALYADSRPSAEDAEALCGVGTADECPLLLLCRDLGFTESVYADEMIYGGKLFKRGLPVDPSNKKRKRGPKFK